MNRTLGKGGFNELCTGLFVRSPQTEYGLLKVVVAWFVDIPMVIKNVAIPGLNEWWVTGHRSGSLNGCQRSREVRTLMFDV